jgi:predicted GTPase
MSSKRTRRGTKRTEPEEPKKERILIIGAAGRDFHNFNCCFRQDDKVEVVGFTAAQIPKIDGRMYPKSLAGKLYPKGLNIWPEKDLEKIVADEKVDTCILSYSDLSDKFVAHMAYRVLATGASFKLLGYKLTLLPSSKPVIAITAIRTGCGKSQTSRYVVAALKKHNKTCTVSRHPMPYGDLAKQAVQRFENYADLEKHKVTIEEREEYEQHIDANTVVFAGVDYEAILRDAEKECDVVIWDGGNNDTPFYKPDLWIVVADPHRQGHELDYYPGNTNFCNADVIVINKANTAPAGTVQKIVDNAKKYNPKAKVVIADSDVTVDKPELIKGKKVLVIDDGPTLTHGEMPYGAGKVAADKYEAKEAVDPIPHAVGSLKDVFAKFTHLQKTLPAMGYYDEQIKDLEASVAKTPCESVIIATPMDLRRLIKINQPSTIAKYNLVDRADGGNLGAIIDEFVKTH